MQPDKKEPSNRRQSKVLKENKELPVSLLSKEIRGANQEPPENLQPAPNKLHEQPRTTEDQNRLCEILSPLIKF